jgi:hypothetical protein
MHFASCSPASGSAHEEHFDPLIFGREVQQPAQQEATRSLQARSAPQETHQAGRTILVASRPRKDSARAIAFCTQQFYRRGRYADAIESP